MRWVWNSAVTHGNCHLHNASATKTESGGSRIGGAVHAIPTKSDDGLALRSTGVLLLLAAATPNVASLDNGASPLPYLGWSSWNAFGDLSTHTPPIGSKDLLEIADIVVSSGLKDAGYVNFNVDAGWAHDGTFMGRGADGKLRPNPQLFPEGMKSFCDKLHDKGLKCGLCKTDLLSRFTTARVAELSNISAHFRHRLRADGVRLPEWELGLRDSRRKYLRQLGRGSRCKP